jgi:hypothetical protein
VRDLPEPAVGQACLTATVTPTPQNSGKLLWTLVNAGPRRRIRNYLQRTLVNYRLRAANLHRGFGPRTRSHFLNTIRPFLRFPVLNDGNRGGNPAELWGTLLALSIPLET